MSKKKNKKSKEGKKGKRSKRKPSSDESDEGKPFVWIFMIKWTKFHHCEFADIEPVHVVNTFIEMPEGAHLSDDDENNKNNVDDPHRALDIDLDT